MKWARKHTGFTIVELLIVIVVIAILATLTIVAYNGIRERAQQSAQATTLSQAARKVLAYATQNAESYPASLSAVGLADSGDTVYEYEADNTVSPKYYCLAVTVGGQPTRFVSSKNNEPAAGSCRDLVGWWPLNGDYDDYAKYSHATAALGSATATAGQNGASGAYVFGGDGLEVGNFDYGVMRTGGAASNWSMTVWVQATGAVMDESIILGRSGCHGGLYTRSSAYQFAIKSSSNSSNCWSGSTSLVGASADSSWHFLAATYEAGVMRLYVDGALAGSGTIAAMYNYPPVLRIGGVGGRPLSANVDDARVYTRVLSGTEIQDMYAAGAF